MKKVLRSKLTAGILVLAVVSLGIVLAGDVVVKEGDMDIGGKVDITGPDGTGTTGEDAPDVLVASGGKGAHHPSWWGGKGSDIVLASGRGGTGRGGGNGGDIELNTGAGGQVPGSDDGAYGNVYLAKNGGCVMIRNATTPTYPLEVYGNTSDITAWFEAKICATGYETHSPSDKGYTKNYLDLIKSPDEMVDPDTGKLKWDDLIGGEKVIYSTTDWSRPETCYFEQDVNKEHPYTCYPYQIEHKGMGVDHMAFYNRLLISELKQENQMLKEEIAKLKAALGVE